MAPRDLPGRVLSVTRGLLLQWQFLIFNSSLVCELWLVITACGLSHLLGPVIKYFFNRGNCAGVLKKALRFIDVSYYWLHFHGLLSF